MTAGTGRVVLVTGVSRTSGGRLARALADGPAAGGVTGVTGDAGVERVIGVDVVPPRADLGNASFVRADIRNPVIAKVIAGEDVDTVVHMSLQSAPGRSSGARSAMKEHNVIGTMQLLAACQRAPGLQRLVVRSSTSVYGSSSRDPAMFTEEMTARRPPSTGYAKDMLEVEGYVRGFARRRPDVSVTLLRPADVVGPTATSVLTRYLRLPVVPTVAGYDARLQLLHETDLLAALWHATLEGVHGTFNLAGDGVLMLSQAVHRLGRPTMSVPGFAWGSLGSVLAPAGLTGLAAELLDFATFGRGVDTTRMRGVLGFSPEHTTSSALAEFAPTVPLGPLSHIAAAGPVGRPGG